MGDRSSNKSNIDHALKVLNHMMLAPEELRDELFCQLWNIWEVRSIICQLRKMSSMVTL